MLVKIKKLHENAVIPTYSKVGDAGLDLTAVSVIYDDKTDTLEYSTGLAIEIPEGYVGLIFPRSSIYKKEISQSNCVGVLDSNYRGDIKVRYNLDLGNWWEIMKEGHQEDMNLGAFNYYEEAINKVRNTGVIADIYAVGDRIAQLIIIPYPQIELVESDELSETNRGADGFGSTGN